MLASALILFFFLVGVYWNHFDNGFYFDDIHTIVQNEAIRQIDLHFFFTDISAFGTMPNNRGYRPVVALLNAVDYQLAGRSLNPTVFHISIFSSYLLLGIALFFSFRELLRRVHHEQVDTIALLIASAYMFHTANAETINYIISRSDTFSTLCMVLTLLLYQLPKTRRWLLYLLPLATGLFTKEVAFMIVPLLWLYHLLFVEETELVQFLEKRGWKKAWRATVATLPSTIVGVALIGLNLLVMTDTSRLHGGLANPRFDYFTSQFPVVVHYIGNFLLPINLSADPDFKVTAGLSITKLLCLALIVLLHALALVCFRRKILFPIGYGMVWFFVCLVPTSTINPLYQVANDHRTFLPYIGTTLSFGWGIFLLYKRVSNKSWAQAGLMVFLACYFVGHGYGIYQRNEVWGSAETLWADAVRKSPNNGRAQMNYGLALMAKGEYEAAEPYFERALQMLPTWTYTHINMAVLQDAIGRPERAESYFKKALKLGPQDPEAHYFYARWLVKQERDSEARDLLAKGRSVSPRHVKINRLLDSLKPEKQIAALQRSLAEAESVNGYLDLSLLYYQQGDYVKCVEVCQAALELAPNHALVHNNLCSAYIKLKDWKQAVHHGQRAVELKPDFQRARNNLRVAQAGLKSKEY